jgi:hypothetical protein
MKHTAPLLLVFAYALGAASSQENDSDTSSRSEEQTPAPDQLELCFNAEGFTDFNVMTDGHIYVRTRGGNHYLVTTEHCENLERSYQRGTARLVPYGRRVCQGDGSHVVYDANGRELACPILTIDRVQDRAEALQLAEETAPLIRVEEAPPQD